MSEGKPGYVTTAPDPRSTQEILDASAREQMVLALDELQGMVGIWNDEMFGTERQLPLAAHLRREAEELHESIRDAIEFGSLAAVGHMADECADMMHLLCAIAHQSGFSLAEATLKKFAVNQGRQWKAPDQDGCIEHEKS